MEIRKKNERTFWKWQDRLEGHLAKKLEEFFDFSHSKGFSTENFARSFEAGELIEEALDWFVGIVNQLNYRDRRYFFEDFEGAIKSQRKLFKKNRKKWIAEKQNALGIGKRKATIIVDANLSFYNRLYDEVLKEIAMWQKQLVF